jgi:hypothetical protein
MNFSLYFIVPVTAQYILGNFNIMQQESFASLKYCKVKPNNTPYHSPLLEKKRHYQSLSQNLLTHPPSRKLAFNLRVK